jgi:hypothetical protein
LNSAALLFAGIAIASVGPFAQSAVFAVVLGAPLALAGLLLGARRTGTLALLSIGSALAIFLINDMRGVEYVAVGVVLTLAIVAAWMGFAYVTAKKSASLDRTL